jgi:hypothetical protein
MLTGAPTTDTLDDEAPLVAAALSGAESEVLAALSRASAAVKTLDESLVRAAGAAEARTLRALGTLRTKAERVARRRRSDAHARLARVEAALLPAGKLQERALSALGLYARYGPQMGDLIGQAIDLDARWHEVVDLP